MKERWVLHDKQVDFLGIARELGTEALLVKLMVNRGICDIDGMRQFLYGDMSDLSDAYLMKDLKKACDILCDIANAQDTIAIVSDYDCDGVFSGMILYTGLKKIGAKPVIFTPDRIKDGYGINRRIIDEIHNKGIRNIITCDNGIAAKDEIAYAKSLGMTVIITDHHEIPYDESSGVREYIIPAADAVCNPKQEDCGYPYKHLCGAGVCLRIITTLYDICRIDKNEEKILVAYAAIATVADIMELTGENRIIVKEGLKILSETDNPGLHAIREVNDLLAKKINAYHIGFIIGPCFNAAGRIESVETAFELLMTDDREKASALAAKLKEINDIRKSMTEEGAERAIEIASGEEYKDKKILVIYLPDCHESLIGIIAGRVKERFYKPCIVFTDAENDTYKGSARSIPGYDMFYELSRVKELFIKMGGHAAAAGMTISKGAFNALSEKLNANTTLTDTDLTPVVDIDADVLVRHMTVDVVDKLAELEPYGNANAKPLFVGRHFNIRRAVILGKNKNVLKLTVSDREGRVCDAVLFNDIDVFLQHLTDRFGEEEVQKMMHGARNATDMALVFNADVNEYNGLRTVQFVVRHYL
ncbi:MAG: single-stranded-DNA-specific exonuclease RecJ [Lachnospiraceae bacterium]|nr:single-stranded-DNA-specific exonuclease RecJ [Lachnospiraceae bacterium]